MPRRYLAIACGQHPDIAGQPKISLWHGTSDPIVKPSNGEHIIRQWANVHGLSESPSYRELIGSHTRRLWSDANNKALIEAFSITGVAHAVPLGLSAEADAYGAAGPFFLDVGICSTRRIAHFWGLETEGAGARQTGADATGASRQSAAMPGDAAPVAGRQQQVLPPDADAWPLDATAAIGAAFKAAGLPLRQGFGSVTPASIIAAALEAAGLRK